MYNLRGYHILASTREESIRNIFYLSTFYLKTKGLFLITTLTPLKARAHEQARRTRRRPFRQAVAVPGGPECYLSPVGRR